MPAKQGLNDWGAFTGGASSGDYDAASSTFGFGPLLFHHGGSEQLDDDGDDETCSSTTQERKNGQMARGADAFEMDRLLLNDPISFNPLQAISWAKLDYEPAADEDKGKGSSSASAGIGRDGSGGGGGGSGAVGFQQPADNGGFGASSRHDARQRDDYAGNHPNTHVSIASSMNTEVPEDNMHVSYAASRAAESSEPSQSPIGTMSQTFSSVSLQQTPNTSDGRSITFVPPQKPTSSVPTPNTSHGAGQHGQRQQRKHRHRHGTKTNHAEPSWSKTQNESYQQHQQQQGYPAPLSTALPTSAGEAVPSSVPVQQHPFPLAPQTSYNSTYQTTCATPYTTVPLQATNQQTQPPPAADHLFLCLGPYCSARFATEAELNAHYRAEHSLTCSWASCGASGFTSNNALVWHVKAEHLLLCPVPGCCDRVFASKKALEGHVRVQ